MANYDFNAFLKSIYSKNSNDGTQIMAQNASARQCASLNCQRPKLKEKKDRKRAIEAINNLRLCKNAEAYVAHTSIEKHHSKVPFEELKPITLKEMMIPNVHKGSYLLCRTVSQPLSALGIMTLIEDVNGDVEDLTLKHLRNNFNDDPSTIVPIGTILIIKEPFLIYTTNDTKINVDSPSDIIFLYPNDPILKDFSWYKPQALTFEELKAKGNQYYSQNDFYNSLRYYDQALMVQQSPVIYLNRSAVYLKLNRFYEAYQDGKHAMNDDANKEKALFRMGKAAYGMREWKSAVDHFNSLVRSYPNNKMAKDELIRANQRLQESITGVFDMAAILREYKKNKNCCLDIADYIGPVKVADIPNKGKGLVATTDIKKGTLLLVSKAFTISHIEDVGESIFTSVNFRKNTYKSQTKLLNFTKTVYKLKINPNMAKELYSLYAGDMDRSGDIPDVIDPERIEQICTINSFGPKTPYGAQLVDDTEMNSSYGLWITPSYINHSCLSNAYYSSFGDIMVFYAIKDIPKDEEITISYLYQLASYRDRFEVFDQQNFICNCQLCEIDRNDQLYDVREQLVEKGHNFIFKMKERGNQKEALKRAVELVADVEETYENRNEFKFQLRRPLRLLGDLYYDLKKYEKAIQCYLKILNFHDGIYYELTNLCLKISECYNKTGNSDLGKQWYEKGAEFYEIKSGITRDIFPELMDLIFNENNVFIY